MNWEMDLLHFATVSVRKRFAIPPYMAYIHNCQFAFDIKMIG